jgi:hypothetical protein
MTFFIVTDVKTSDFNKKCRIPLRPSEAEIGGQYFQDGDIESKVLSRRITVLNGTVALSRHKAPRAIIVASKPRGLQVLIHTTVVSGLPHAGRRP